MTALDESDSFKDLTANNTSVTSNRTVRGVAGALAVVHVQGWPERCKRKGC